MQGLIDDSISMAKETICGGKSLLRRLIIRLFRAIAGVRRVNFEGLWNVIFVTQTPGQKGGPQVFRTPCILSSVVACPRPSKVCCSAPVLSLACCSWSRFGTTLRLAECHALIAHSLLTHDRSHSQTAINDNMSATAVQSCISRESTTFQLPRLTS